MDIQDYIGELESRLADLESRRVDDVLVIAFDLAAQIKLRIQSRGEDFRGRRWTGTLGYVPGYAKRRKRKGFQTDYVDYTITGRLMNNVQPRIVSQDRGTVTVDISASNRENEVKLLGAVKKRGNILLPNDKELQIAAAANVERVLKRIFDI